jgi:hypothetical protein
MCSEKKYIYDEQEYCVNLSTFLLDAMKNHLNFDYKNHGFLHESQAPTQLENNMIHAKL